MVSSFVALSTTYSGVEILPMSCIHAAILSSFISSFDRLKSRHRWSSERLRPWAISSVISATRRICPPV
ncbi:hypothetical protein MBAV_000420 [Candidatus Magnetobacterium bavaricum]|uniref:Uncharacterized protein n=1 Tax=Candidatus Magnetobacterium bavaricum TaxID=29290 RepID=A0A0F3GZQ2_9BACT|nr:hypothetical protein MBAV_000420 [Candidatus Magnetobacterium bavaricum]